MKILLLSLILFVSLGNMPTADAARGKAVTLEQAVADVKAQTGGRILSANTRGGTHVIKVLLPSGKVRIIRIKAR